MPFRPAHPARWHEGSPAIRQIVVSMWTTVDGYVAGPEDEMDWLAVNEEMMDYETSLVRAAEALLLGRVTHSDFADAWPRIAQDESEAAATRAYAQRVDEMPKLVASRSGNVADWRNSSRVSLDENAIGALKRDGYGDLVIYGSLSVIAALQALDAIDEYHLLVHPTAIGEGRPLFARGTRRLQLGSVRALDSGVLLTRYSTA